jgi:hypothetical protein
MVCLKTLAQLPFLSGQLNLDLDSDQNQSDSLVAPAIRDNEPGPWA